MNKSQIIKDFRQRRKENLVKVLGSKCQLCGYNKCIGALEFHHINPKNKSFGLSNGNCHSLNDDLTEAKKCILVCSNCHREIHHTNNFSEEYLWSIQFYDNEYAQQLLLEAEPKKCFCQQCGCSISKNTITGLCSKCYAISNRKVERPDREELKELIRKTPFTQIGIMYGVTDNAVRKWCDKFNLPRRKFEIDSYTNEEWTTI